MEDWLYTPKFREEWDRRPLHSMAQWVNGLAFRNIQFSPSGMPVIKIAEVKGGISGQTKFTHQEFDDSVRVRPGDLLFSWSGQPETSIDAFWWNGPEGWLNQHVFRVTTNAEVDTTFFYYLLRYLKPNFVGIARNKQTTGLGHVTRRDLENIEAALPSLTEQQAIAHILGTLDDKIELNRRMNQTLETMARAIFQDWFVDFGPVRAKMEGLDPYLSPELWGLFPDDMVDSELGTIPEGWEVRPLSDFGKVVYGAAFASKRFSESGLGLPLIRIRDLATHNPVVFTDEEHPKGQLIKAGDIVVGMDGEFRAHIWKGPNSWLNQRVCHLKPHSGIPRQFLFENIRAPLADFERGKVGTTVIHLSKTDIDSMKFVLPTAQVLEAYAGLAEPFVDKAVANATESRTLATNRDTLLPKLMSGGYLTGNGQPD